MYICIYKSLSLSTSSFLFLSSLAFRTFSRKGLTGPSTHFTNITAIN